jgi:hypothetical protein
LNTKSESEIYLEAKNCLKLQKWTILGGQPPKGSDHLPIIEIKMEVGRKRGSEDAFKPDLVCIKNSRILIVELKPRYDIGDHEKLMSFLDSQERIRNLMSELYLRKLIHESQALENQFLINGCLGFSGNSPAIDPLWRLKVEENGSELIACAIKSDIRATIIR